MYTQAVELRIEQVNVRVVVAQCPANRINRILKQFGWVLHGVKLLADFVSKLHTLFTTFTVGDV